MFLLLFQRLVIRVFGVMPAASVALRHSATASDAQAFSASSAVSSASSASSSHAAIRAAESAVAVIFTATAETSAA